MILEDFSWILSAIFCAKIHIKNTFKTYKDISSKPNLVKSSQKSNGVAL